MAKEKLSGDLIDESIFPGLSSSTRVLPLQVANELRVKTNTLAVWRCEGIYDLPYCDIGGISYLVGDVRGFVRSGFSRRGRELRKKKAKTARESKQGSE